MIKSAVFRFVGLSVSAICASAQTNNAVAGPVFSPNYHIGFERPEAWGLKYFASASLLSGLPLPQTPGEWHSGSIAIGVELGWLPTLDAGQQRIGFNGTSPEDLNKAPLFARPVLRVGLPGKLTAVAAAPLPAALFGITPHLFAFGLERPLLERNRWTLGWRAVCSTGWPQVVEQGRAWTRGWTPPLPGRSAGENERCFKR